MKARHLGGWTCKTDSVSHHDARGNACFLNLLMDLISKAFKDIALRQKYFFNRLLNIYDIFNILLVHYDKYCVDIFCIT